MSELETKYLGQRAAFNLILLFIVAPTLTAIPAAVLAFCGLGSFLHCLVGASALFGVLLVQDARRAEQLRAGAAAARRLRTRPITTSPLPPEARSN